MDGKLYTRGSYNRLASQHGIDGPIVIYRTHWMCLVYGHLNEPMRTRNKFKFIQYYVYGVYELNTNEKLRKNWQGSISPYLFCEYDHASGENRSNA